MKVIIVGIFSGLLAIGFLIQRQGQLQKQSAIVLVCNQNTLIRFQPVTASVSHTAIQSLDYQKAEWFVEGKCQGNWTVTKTFSFQ